MFESMGWCKVGKLKKQSINDTMTTTDNASKIKHVNYAFDKNKSFSIF